MKVTDALKKDMKKDFPEFQDACRKFFNKEMTIPEYKHISGNFGSYAERGAETGMIRLRLAGGAVKPYQYEFLKNAIVDYKVPLVHFTTSQSIQLHRLTAEPIIEIMEKAAEVDIFTRGGGGDNPRNVTASPLRGVDKNEYFDVTPYLDVVAVYCLSLINELHLPRKLKIAIGGNAENDVHTTFRDLGFQARPDGTFDVYSAGGLGPNPSCGVLVGEAVDPSQVLYYVRAMADTFMECGNYEKRSRARSRFMPMDMGVEEYKAAFAKNLAKALEAGGLDFTVEEHIVNKEGTTPLDIAALNEKELGRIIEQKQNGLYTVYYHPLGGSPEPETMVALLAALQEMEETEIRLTMDESAYIINLTADEVQKVLAITADSAKNAAETSVSCVGNTVCQIGIQDSHGLLMEILDALRPHHFADGVIPKFHISGCPSSCGTHQIGTIGLHGGMKMIDKKPNAAFNVAIGGTENLGKESFGEVVGIITAKNIPAFFVALGEEVTAKNMTFVEYIKGHAKEFKALVNSFE